MYELNIIENTIEEISKYLEKVYDAGYETRDAELKDALYTKEQLERACEKAYEQGSIEGYDKGIDDENKRMYDICMQEVEEVRSKAKKEGFEEGLQEGLNKNNGSFDDGLEAAFEALKMICDNDHKDRKLDRKLMDAFNTVSPELILKNFSIKEIVYSLGLSKKESTRDKINRYLDKEDGERSNSLKKFREERKERKKYEDR